MAAPIVPLPRNLMLGSKGLDVIAVKRALSHAGFMQWGQFTPTYGEGARRAVHAFQKAHGIPYAGYGEKTHYALRHAHVKGSTKFAFQKYEITIMQDVYEQIHVSPETRIRNKIIQMAQYIYAHRMATLYSQARPFPLLHIGDPPPHHLDCSGFFTLCHYAAGAKNPNIEGGVRLGWDGEGYTGTLQAGGERVPSVSYLRPGDAIFYGFTVHTSPAFAYGAPTHVAVFEGNAEQDVFSMGGYPLRHSYYRYWNAINSYYTFDVTP
jgi:cell wall-associated NlpC family hydrolase